MRGTKALLSMLEKKGVDTVFGYPGGSVISVYDELVDSPIRHVLVRHEQCAAHMADGYARAKNQPGVCIATSGPGATNLVTGIATAYADSSPIIALTGQVAAGSLGQGAFQEVDAYSLLMPITKHSYRVLDVNRLPHAVSEAWEICQMGRRGPVHIDLPIDQMNSDIDESLLDERFGVKPLTEDLSGLHEAVQWIREAQRPLILVGGGAIDASEEVMELARIMRAPVVNTLMGMGVVPSSYELNLGPLGLHGRLSARPHEGPAGQGHPHRHRRHRVQQAQAPVRQPAGGRQEGPEVAHLRHGVQARRKTQMDRACAAGQEEPRPRRRQMLRPHRPAEGHARDQQVHRRRHHRHHRRGTEPDVGHALPGHRTSQAVPDVGHVRDNGLRAPRRDRGQITGDGGLQMVIQELATSVAEDLPVTVVLLNNGCLGMIKQMQKYYWNGRYSAMELKDDPDFVTVAKGFRCNGIHVERPEEIGDALRQAMDSDVTTVVEIMVDPEADILPMLPMNPSIPIIRGDCRF